MLHLRVNRPARADFLPFPGDHHFEQLDLLDGPLAVGSLVRWAALRGHVCLLLETTRCHHTASVDTLYTQPAGQALPSPMVNGIR